MKILKIVGLAIAFWTLCFFAGFGAGKAFSDDYISYQVLAFTDCLKQVEWVVVVAPDGWNAFHYTEIKADPALRAFMKEQKPVVIQTPAGVCI